MTLAKVRQLPGIHEVTGDLASGRLIVTYDPARVTPDDIVSKVKEAGFSVDGRFAP